MAKRVRGQRSAHRPGGQGPSRTPRSPVGAPTAGPEAPTLPNPATWSSASVVEPAASGSPLGSPVAGSGPAPSRPAAPRNAVTPPPPRARTRSRADSLDVRAAAELVWVAEDLRRIAFLTAVLFLALAAAWVLLVPVGLFGIY